jgi:ribose-phosphate pyrophosphokinase
VVIVFDDLIASGTTMARAAAACLERGAQAVHGAATHGIFADGAIDALGASSLASLVVTDTLVDVARRCQGLRTMLHVLESAPVFAHAVDHWVHDREIVTDLTLDAD